MGPLSFGKKDEQIFLGREMSTHKNYSEATAVEIDTEIRRIVDEAYERALTILKDNLQNLHNISECLIEKENLTGAEVDEIIAAGAPVYGHSPDTPAESGPETPHADLLA
jgi:cell division protease FtsH